jgi:hypothetical protein
MRRLLAGLAFAAALLGGDPLPAVRADGPAVRIDPNFAPLGLPPNVGLPPRAFPPVHRPAYRSRRPVVNCDVYGRCWQHSPGYRYGAPRNQLGHRRHKGDRPPGWADDLPYRTRDPYRFERPRSGVVCDRGTGLCYKRG